MPSPEMPVASYADHSSPMEMPSPRGPLSRAVLAVLGSGAVAVDSEVLEALELPAEGDGHPTRESAEDAALVLWLLYELHYRGIEGVREELEWDPALLALRRRLEDDLEARLRGRYRTHVVQGDFAEDFFDYVAGHDGRSVASYVHRQADAEQVRQLLRVRSIYHLKESDPSAWVVPRLPLRSQAALMEVLYDEYGVGDPGRLHAHLFAKGMAACGLDTRYARYLDEAPLEVLEQNNAMSLFGLHRRLRGAAMGHLAAFEASSSVPSRRMVIGLERLELPMEIARYYEEHVAADAVHEQLAVRSICGALVEAEPELVDSVFLGAFSCLDLEDRFAGWMLEHWGVEEADAA